MYNSFIDKILFSSVQFSSVVVVVVVNYVERFANCTLCNFVSRLVALLNR
jgi:hypothetical protein